MLIVVAVAYKPHHHHHHQQNHGFDATGGNVSSRAVCKNGETSKIVAIPGFENGLVGPVVTGLDETSCGKACLKGKLPNGTSIECHSALFKGGKCTLSKDTRAMKPDLKKAVGSTYYQQLCLPTDIVKDCPDFFYEQPQKILLGQNTLTIDVDPGTIDCAKACLEAKKTRGFECTSGTFYYKEPKQNCILNIENSKTKPDLFQEDNQNTVTYFELICKNGAAAAAGGEKHKISDKHTGNHKPRHHHHHQQQKHDDGPRDN